MPNRRLAADELIVARAVLKRLRARLVALSAGDEDLLWALRRKIFKELIYDERGKPMQRRALKLVKRMQQGGKCALCRRRLPKAYCVLDRLVAMKGYTVKNTRLLCPACDTRVQKERRYA